MTDTTRAERIYQEMRQRLLDISKADTPAFCDMCNTEMTDEDWSFGCFENQWCQACLEKWTAEQDAHWRPLYEGEKLAGMLPANHYKEPRQFYRDHDDAVTSQCVAAVEAALETKK